MAKSEQQKLKDKLDTIFSKFIRLRDSNDRGECECITCGDIRYWEKSGMQNGHYMPRNYLITRFDEDNCHAQCENCNLWKNKTIMQITYREELVDLLGEEEVVVLEKKRHEVVHYDTDWYKERISHYTKRVEEML